MPTLQVAVDARKMKEGAAEGKKALSDLQHGAAEAKDGLAHMQHGMDEAGHSAHELKHIMVELLGGLAVAEIIKEAVTAMSQMESSLLRVKAIGRLTDEEFGSVREEIDKMGLTTAYTALEISGAMLTLETSGMSAGKALEALPAVLDLTTLSGGNLNEMASTVARTLRQFGMQADETRKVVDALFAVAGPRSGATFQELIGGLRSIGPLAHAVGVSFDEATAAIGAASHAGMSAETAGMGLKIILAKLLVDGKAMSQVLKEMGLHFADVDPHAHSLSEIFETLHQHGMDATKAIEMFSQRGAGLAVTLANNADFMDKLSAATKDEAGESERAAAIINGSMQQAFKRIKQVVEEVYTGIGDRGLAGGIKKVANIIADTVVILLGFEGELNHTHRAASLCAGGVTMLGGAMALVAASVIAKTIATMAIAMFTANTAAATLRNTMLSLQGTLLIVTAALAGFETANYLSKISRDVKGMQLGWAAIVNYTEIFMKNFDIIGDNTQMVDQMKSLNKLLIEQKAAIDSENTGKKPTFIESVMEDARAAMDRLKPLHKELAKLSTEATDAGAAGAEMDGMFDDHGAAAANLKALQEQLDQMNSAIDREIGLSDASSQQKEIATKLDQYAVLIGKLDLENQNDLIDAYNRKLHLLAQLNAVEEYKKDIEALKQEEHLIGMTNQQREKEVALLKLRKDLMDVGMGRDEIQKYTDALGQEYDALHKLQTEQKKADDQTRRLQDLAQGTGDAFATAFSDAILRGEKLNAVLKNLLTSLTDLVFQQLAMKPMAAFISGLATSAMGVPAASYNGNVIQGGNIIHHEMGGVVSRNSFFQMANGQMGSVAEFNRPEGILPLAEMADGKLGVHTTGGSGGVTIHMNINTKDVDGFRRSSSQLMARAKRQADLAFGRS